MTTTDPFTLATQLGVLSFLAAKLATARKEDLGPKATKTLPPGSRLPVIVGGEQAGWLSVVAGRSTASVTDEHKFLAWAKEHAPTEVVTVEQVRPSFTDAVLKAVKDRGGWIDANGELLEVPGVTVKAGEPYPKVDLAADAGEIIGRAWRDIDLPQMLALPGGEV